MKSPQILIVKFVARKKPIKKKISWGKKNLDIFQFKNVLNVGLFFKKKSFLKI